MGYARWPCPNDDSFGSVIVGKDIDDVDQSVSLLWSATSGKFLFNFGNDESEIITSTDAFQAGSFYFVAALQLAG
jgi:hypothetical protein